MFPRDRVVVGQEPPYPRLAPGPVRKKERAAQPRVLTHAPRAAQATDDYVGRGLRAELQQLGFVVYDNAAFC